MSIEPEELTGVLQAVPNVAFPFATWISGAPDRSGPKSPARYAASPNVSMSGVLLQVLG